MKGSITINNEKIIMKKMSFYTGGYVGLEQKLKETENLKNFLNIKEKEIEMSEYVIVNILKMIIQKTTDKNSILYQWAWDVATSRDLLIHEEEGEYWWRWIEPPKIVDLFVDKFDEKKYKVSCVADQKKIVAEEYLNFRPEKIFIGPEQKPVQLAWVGPWTRMQIPGHMFF